MDERRAQLDEMKMKYSSDNEIYRIIESLIDGTYNEETVRYIEYEINRIATTEPGNTMIEDWNILREVVLEDIASRVSQTGPFYKMIGNISQKKYTNESKQKIKQIINATLKIPFRNSQKRKNYTIISKLLEVSEKETPAIIPIIDRTEILQPQIQTQSQIQIITHSQILPDIELDPIQALKQKIDKCSKECNALNKELSDLQQFDRMKKIEGISMPSNSTLFELLLDRILDPVEEWATNIRTLIDIPHSVKEKDFLRGGDYFEALFQIAIAISEISMLRNKFVRFYDIKNYKNDVLFDNYLYTKTIKNSGGGEHGISDITFVAADNEDFVYKPSTKYTCGMPIQQNTLDDNPMYFITVKGYKKEKSPAKDYDIPLLNMQLSVLPHIKEKRIIVCVRNKDKFLKKIDRTTMEMLKHNIHHVIGFDEIMEAFAAFRIKIFTKLGSITPAKGDVEKLLRSVYPQHEISKPLLSLYFHQDLIVRSTINRIKEIRPGTTKNTEPHYICIGVLPRGGKSFIAGGIINEHRKDKPHGVGYNVLFLTSAVNETRSQFRNDLIEKFSDFRDMNFIDVVSSEEKGIEVEGTPATNNFYFVSRQLSTLPEKQVKYEEAGEDSITKQNILTQLKNKLGTLPAFDICFFDEAHIGITAKSVRDNFNATFSVFPQIPIVLMTATYKKPSSVLRSDKDLFVWDLQDIKDMKSLPILGLNDFLLSKPDILIRYPYAESLLQERIGLGESLETLAKPYMNFATPNFISLTFSPEEIKRMIQKDTGYDFKLAFEIDRRAEKLSILNDTVRHQEWHSLLINKEHSSNLLQFLTPDFDPSDNIMIGNDRKFRALNQIFSISQKNGSRPIQGNPFSILMFLPYWNGGPRTGEICRMWASFMRTKRYWLDNFVFLTLSVYGGHASSGRTIVESVNHGIIHRDDYLNQDLKGLIIEVEREALKINKGLVILSGDVAKMGISLPCVDIVCMMSVNTDADDIIQKMYRALTDDPPLKKGGFIIDLNLKRIVKAMFDYDLQKDRLRTGKVVVPSVEERLMRIINLCNWGQDSVIQDNAGWSFDDVMKNIKDRVVISLGEKIRSENTTESIKKEQIERFGEMTGFIEEVQKQLSGTVKKKCRKPAMGDTYTRGANIPTHTQAVDSRREDEGGDEDRENGREGDPSASNTARPSITEPILTEEEAKEKMFQIILTFINTIVIKSSEDWTVESMNLAALIEKYKKDKLDMNGKVISCDCDHTSALYTNNINPVNRAQNTLSTYHKNMYEVVFCELKAYAYKMTKFSLETHKSIMDLIDKAIESPLIGWNIYIENLLRDLRNQSGGKGAIKQKRKTRRLNRRHGNRNRKTLQQRFRNY